MIENVQTWNSESHCTETTSMVVSAACALYELGLNVFPVMRPEIATILAQGNLKVSPTAKRPYLLKPLFYSRLHHCTNLCRQYEQETGHRCAGKYSSYRFENLFTFSNIGLMLGRLSKNMVCLDCDTPSAYQQSKEQFTALGLDHWAFTSSRGGNILFRCAEGEIKNSSQCYIPGAEVWGHHHFCVLPPSIHHSGCFYTWEYPNRSGTCPPAKELPAAISIHELKWLGVQLKNKKTKSELFGLPEWTLLLSQKNREILVTPLQKGERNQQLTKVTYDIAAQIYEGLVSYTEGIEILESAANQCLPPYPHHDIQQMMDSALNKKNLTAAKSFRYQFQNNNTDITPLLNFAHNYDWRKHGRTALTDRTVFFACLRRAQIDGKEKFRASSRELAEIANYQTHKTILSSLKRLKKQGLLKFEEVDSSQAHCYSFGNYFDNIQLPTIKTSKYNGAQNVQIFDLNLPSKTIEKDIFKGIGINGYLVWKHLLMNPGDTVQNIADIRNLRITSIRNSLSKMEEYKLIEYSKSEGNYIAKQLPIEQMEAICIKLGTFQNAEHRKHKFMVEREINVNHKLTNKIAQINQIIQYIERKKS